MDTEPDDTWRFTRALERLQREQREAELQLSRLVAASGQVETPETTAELKRAHDLVLALSQRDRLLRLRAATEELGEGD